MDDEYLARLAALPLQQIRDEPAALAAAAGQLTGSITALCHAQYPTFLLAHGSSSSLKSTFSSLDTSLNALIDSLQPLSDQCTAFAHVTQPILADRRRATLLLDHHDKLQDLLELPQLLTTCIVNSSYQDALDLIAHARTLAGRFPDVAVVQDVRAEVEHAARVMAAQLLGVLCEPAKLPVLSRAVNFLRRMGELAEDELALAFLTSRLALFDASAAALRDKEAKSAVEHTGEDDARILRKYADAFRESTYDVVSQFNNIFLERVSGDTQADLHHLLTAFVQTLIQRLVSTVRTTLVPLDPARLPQPGTVSALLTHLSYTATSLARLGLDFRALLDEPARQSLLLRTRHSLKVAVDEFTSAVSKSAAAAPPPASTSSTASPDTPLHIPPQSLAAFPPLASFTNNFVHILNALRLLAPTAQSLQPQLHELLAEALVQCAKVMKSVDETPWGKAAQREFAVALVPFAERALLEGIFGQKPTAVVVAEPVQTEGDVEDEEHVAEPAVNGEACEKGSESDEVKPAAETGVVTELHELLKEWKARTTQTNGA